MRNSYACVQTKTNQQTDKKKPFTLVQRNIIKE